MENYLPPLQTNSEDNHPFLLFTGWKCNILFTVAFSSDAVKAPVKHSSPLYLLGRNKQNF